MNRATNLIYLYMYIYTYVNGQGSREKANHHRLVIMVVLTMFVCWLTKSMTSTNTSIYDELYFRESSSVTSPAEYKYIYIEQGEHEIRSMTSQVVFFFLLVCAHRYCLTDHKFLSLAFWTGEYVIDKID
jgi:hypothetical protein